MSYKLIYTSTFKKHYTSFPLSIQKQIRRKLKLLVDDPSYPSLRTKRIKGTKVFWESSVNMDIRIIWQYDEGEIILTIDVGHHNILNHY